MTGIESLAVFFGLMAVWFTVKQNIWCWPAGLIQVALYCYIFLQVKLYSDLILHVIYIFIQVYGWYHWLKGGPARNSLPVTRLSRIEAWLLPLLTASGSLMWGWGMATWTDASFPFAHAFTTVASLVAMWLQAQKRLASWPFWIAVDVVAIAIYLQKDLMLTSGLYLVFLVMSIIGWREWYRSVVTGEPVGEPAALPGRSA